jgi:probable rRNA maturation factor
MCYLTVHGMLHLLGYDHMDDEEKAEMRKREEIIMDKLNLQR